ncbi:hypothetical protein [Anaeromyxobacter terrae]|uniref:hypothetical protein n=1 Tax=Anaeromyxobacter terrae TaxID=2925406 RepID=UPI001F58B01D|nr:hypothetical protein [Anaeromyxobacter sp. SG22]
MFIVIQGQPRNGDTRVLDSAAGHQRTFDALAAFLSSPTPSIEIDNGGTCHLCPDYPALRAFRMVKTSDKLRTEELPDGVLQVSGRPELLARYIEAFRFAPGAEDHRHPEQRLALTGELDPRSASIIIEADDYAADPERWAADNRE